MHNPNDPHDRIVRLKPPRRRAMTWSPRSVIRIQSPHRNDNHSQVLSRKHKRPLITWKFRTSKLRPDVRLWLLADIQPPSDLCPLCPRKRTLSRIEEKPGLKRCLSNPWVGVTKRRTETFQQFRPQGSPETVSWQQTTAKYRPKAAELCHSSPSADWCVKTPRVVGGPGRIRTCDQTVMSGRL